MNDQNLDAPPAEDNFFDFKCPHCNATVSFPSSVTGKANDCPNCAETLVVPEAGSGSGRRLPVPIATQRLTLRRLAMSDLEDLAGFMEDEELFHYFSHPMNGEEIERWLEGDSQVRFTTPDQHFFLAVVRNDTRKVIGWARLLLESRLREQVTLEILIAREHQRNGFGTEAIGGALEFCFRGIQLHRVVAFCDGRDEAGRRMLEKSGLRCEAEFVEDRRDGNGWVDTLWFALLQREYPPAGTKAAPGEQAERPA